MAERKAAVKRDTKETRIAVTVNLDGTGQAQLHTPVPFLDHMLDQVARHGMIDLEVRAEGDTHIDAHHTVEDIGIVFGQAVAQALGEKHGIRRYGHAYVPLDEALSRVVIDLSGRPGLAFLPLDEPWARRTLHLCARDFGALSVPAALLAQGLRDSGVEPQDE